jgi:antitoxin MazE
MDQDIERLKMSDYNVITEMVMHTTLIKVGNSQGVRLPKAVIEQAGLERDLDLVVEDGAVVIRPAKKIRDGWEIAAAKCRAEGDDILEDWDSTANDFDGDWV